MSVRLAARWIPRWSTTTPPDPGEELTAAEAEQAWARFRLRPHPLRDVSAVDTSTDLLGAPLRTPVVVAPTAFHQLAHPEAECATIAGTGAAGSLFVLSTRASRPIAESPRPRPVHGGSRST